MTALKKFQHIEDYIEYIGGYKNISQLLKSKTAVSLARYDVGIVDSFCNQTIFKKQGYTEKQAVLAKSLVAKYERQLRAQGIDQPDSFNSFRFPIRTVSTKHSVEIDYSQNKIVINFPYNNVLIEKFRTLKASEDTSAQFDYDHRVWHMPITEYSLNFVMAVCHKDQPFYYGDDVVALIDEIMKIENTPYEIKLSEIDGKLSISNAPSSMLEWITEHVGDMTHDNLLKLIDVSNVLGYTVDDTLIGKLDEICPNELQRRFLTHKKSPVKLAEFDFERIMEYAVMTGRTPVYAYISSFAKLSKFKHPDLIYINKTWPDGQDRIKMLISQSPILIGVRKTATLKMAEKVIFIDEIMQNNNQR